MSDDQRFAGLARFAEGKPPSPARNLFIGDEIYAEGADPGKPCMWGANGDFTLGARLVRIAPGYKGRFEFSKAGHGLTGDFVVTREETGEEVARVCNAADTDAWAADMAARASMAHQRNQLDATEAARKDAVLLPMYARLDLEEPQSRAVRVRDSREAAGFTGHDIYRGIGTTTAMLVEALTQVADGKRVWITSDRREQAAELVRQARQHAIRIGLDSDLIVDNDQEVFHQPFNDDNPLARLYYRAWLLGQPSPWVEARKWLGVDATVELKWAG